MMTKKYYIKIADALTNTKKQQELAKNDGINFDMWEFLIDELAYIFENDNENFDEKKFRKYFYNNQ